MPIPTTYRDAVLDGVKAANDALRSLELADEPWVDAFGAVVRAGGVLMFRNLAHLFGAYLPGAGGAPGVLINAKHPLSVQRYTAAHELGHLWMRHEESLDTAAEILGRDVGGRRRKPVEVAAETFAAHFLMPRARVAARIADLGLQARHLVEPRAVYALALWFGVSYQAMAFHLASLKHITPLDAERVANVEPKEIKAELLRGAKPDDPWADVWPLTPAMADRTLVARVGDELAIRLPSQAGRGYLWQTSTVDPAAFDVVSPPQADPAEVRPGVAGGDGTAPQGSPQGARRGVAQEAAPEIPRGVDAEDLPVGVASPRMVRLRVRDQGVHDLMLEERRPFSPAAPPAARFHVRVVGVRKPRLGVATAGTLPEPTPAGPVVGPAAG